MYPGNMPTGQLRMFPEAQLATFGTSMWHSSWSTFGRSTGKDVSGHYEKYSFLLARACGVPAFGVRTVDCWQWRSGHYFHPSFLFFPVFSPSFSPPFFSRFFPSVATFSHRMSARIKKLILRKLLRTPKNLGVDTFPAPLCHFGAPWRLAAILDFAGVAGG